MLALIYKASKVLGMVSAIPYELIDIKGNRKDSETVFWSRKGTKQGNHRIGYCVSGLTSGRIFVY